MTTAWPIIFTAALGWIGISPAWRTFCSITLPARSSRRFDTRKDKLRGKKTGHSSSCLKALSIRQAAGHYPHAPHQWPEGLVFTLQDPWCQSLEPPQPLGHKGSQMAITHYPPPPSRQTALRSGRNVYFSSG